MMRLIFGVGQLCLVKVPVDRLQARNTVVLRDMAFEY